jgi:hypothetical protein
VPDFGSNEVSILLNSSSGPKSQASGMAANKTFSRRTMIAAQETAAGTQLLLTDGMRRPVSEHLQVSSNEFLCSSAVLFLRAEIGRGVRVAAANIVVQF